ncbi:aspartate aminotransferase [Listeria floridensis FSL S10-1187]|uniref:Aminotransferase n=2 Tax=Listeria floridensis TaxID=1494962 RepID=A0ABP3AZW8_9LIST|nr:aspartate aminotransferase [Listeria floridensis FSL S10-1187]
MIPTFTPYLEIPHLSRYRFNVVHIRSTPELIDGRLTYQFAEQEIEKLRNPMIEAVFMVNPSNPSSSALKEDTIRLLQDIVETDNPELMILTDDVYGTFVPEFHSVFSALPFHSACIYSFSKYFGATGWRLGTIALAEENVFDEKLRKLPEASKAELHERYEAITKETEQFKFIDRLVADSREVALNHAAGLSTPQQVQMALFSLFSLLDEADSYKKKAQSICRYRQKLLYEELDLVMPFDHYDSAYYCEFDLLEWIKQHFGAKFGEAFQKESSITKFLMRLALEHGLVLLKGSGFGGSEWSVRISLANLETENYQEIGRRIKKMVSDEFLKWQFEMEKIK